MTDPHDQIVACAQRLGHVFENPLLLSEALTHRSYANENPQIAHGDNERLEFLGDAVLSTVVSSLLWDAFPSATEGELTRRRAELVSERGLAEVAVDLGLGEFLQLGKGELLSGGQKKPRLLSSTLEACLAAIFLDAGIDRAMQCGRQWFQGRLEHTQAGAGDYKSRAQEWFQSQGRPTPSYVLSHTEGPDHDKTFYVDMLLGEKTVSQGSGKTKTEAEQQAAQFALDSEREPSSDPSQ
ncbi:MAG: ribonuclease III [Myxococcales bacterium]|nr:MAG: ribonuclease III [Myxococcales bacterium]